MHLAHNALESNEFTFQFIPIRQVLKCFFEMTNVFNECINYVDVLKNQQKVFSNIIQGELWKSKTTNETDLVFPLLIYFDEFDVGNPLGSHSGIHKLGAVYASVPIVPPEFLSKLNNIFLCMLFHAMELKAFGSNLIFSHLVKELNFLSTEGITIEVDKKNKYLNFN